jgi:TolB-like protein/Tfp pilus assembly protein PilF
VSDDDPATAILNEFEVPPSGGSAAEAAEPPTIWDSSTERQSLSAHRAAQPQESATLRTSETQVTPGFNKPLLAAIIFAVIALAGFFGFRYFKPADSEQISSIAVLPFENRSGSNDTDYLSDGLAESLIYRLTQLPNLKVSPTSSVFRYKGTQADVAQIAKELDVDAVMSGRLAQRGDDLTISVELIDARTKKLIWAEQYDRKMSDLLATQREIATTITQKLQLKLAGEEAKGVTKKYTDSNDAYQLYLRGRYSFAKRTKPDMLAAIEYFQQAIKLDPKFALAYARISETYGSMPAYPYLSPKEAFPQAKAAAEKALQIDPTLSEAHTFLAYSLAIYDWNFPEAERSFKRAIELDPNNSTAHFRYGQIYLIATGHLDEGIAEIKRGLELEPLDVNMGATLATAYMYAGQNAIAMEQAKKTYDLEPTHPIARWIMSQMYTLTGNYAEAISMNEQWLQTDPTNQFALREAGIAYAKSGRRDKAEEMISRFREIGKTQYFPRCRLASIYGALGEKDKAFEELNKAFEARDWELYRMNSDQYFVDLRDDPRYGEIIKRLNLPK